MSSSKGMEEYYQKVIQLQEKLRQSEEERLKLEMKYNEMIQHIKEEEEVHLKKIRLKYKQFLEGDRRRQQRNDNILDALDRIENRSTMWDAKTKKFKAFRKRFQHYLKPNYEIDDHADNISNYLQNVSSTKLSNAKPEDKYSNLGNINSICRKTTLDAGIDNDSIKTSKDFQNSLKQNKQPNAKVYSSKLDKDKCFPDWDSSDKLLCQKSSDEVHTQLKRLLKEDEKYTNIWKPSLLNDTVSTTRNDNEMKKPPLSNKDQVKCLEALTSQQKFYENEAIIENFNNFEEETYSKNQSKAAPILVEVQKQFEDIKENYRTPDKMQEKQIIEDSPKTVALMSDDSKKMYEESKIQAQTTNQTDFNNLPQQILQNVDEDESKDNQQKKLETNTDTEQDVHNKNNERTQEHVNKSINLLQQDDDNGQPFQQYKDQFHCQYDENEKPVQRYDENSQSLGQFDETGVSGEQYDRSGQFLQQHNEDQFHSQYDENEKPVQRYDENSQSLGQFDETGVSGEQYDRSGQFLQQHDEDQFHSQYDENEKPVQRYDENSQSLGQFDETGVSGEQYDRNGQILQQHNEDQFYDHYGENEKPIQHYDENIQLPGQFDESGVPVERYSESGQSFQQYDENSQPIPQYDESGQSILQYDEHNQQFQQYDVNGQEIPYYGEDKVQEQYYDQSGLYPQYDENGQLIQQYDENGQALQQYYENQMLQYDENDQPVLQYEENAQYDENGQFIQYDISDADQKLEDNGECELNKKATEQSYNKRINEENNYSEPSVAPINVDEHTRQPLPEDQVNLKNTNFNDVKIEQSGV